MELAFNISFSHTHPKVGLEKYLTRANCYCDPWVLMDAQLVCIKSVTRMKTKKLSEAPCLMNPCRNAALKSQKKSFLLT